MPRAPLLSEMARYFVNIAGRLHACTIRPPKQHRDGIINGGDGMQYTILNTPQYLMIS